MAYDTLPALNAPSLGGLLEWRGSDVLGRVSAGVTGFEGSGWTLQGSGDASAWLNPLPSTPFRMELGGSGSASRHSSGFDTHLVRADVRAHWVASGWGAWAGLAAAHTRNGADSASAGAVIPGVGLWRRAGDARLTLGYQTPQVYGQRFHELSSAVSVSTARADLTAFAGWRGASSSAIEDESWIGVSAALWVRPSAAVVVAGGRYGPDVLQGLPGGTFLSLGFRVTSLRARPVSDAAARAPLLFTRESAARGAIGFRIQGARSVEVAGDWNDWTPEPLILGPDGRWLIPAGLGPGIYRFNLRVDGVRWIVPEGVPSADDGFGGEVGILIVREDP